MVVEAGLHQLQPGVSGGPPCCPEAEQAPGCPCVQGVEELGTRPLRAVGGAGSTQPPLCTGPGGLAAPGPAGAAVFRDRGGVGGPSSLPGCMPPMLGGPQHSRSRGREALPSVWQATYVGFEAQIK